MKNETTIGPTILGCESQGGGDHGGSDDLLQFHEILLFVEDFANSNLENEFKKGRNSSYFGSKQRKEGRKEEKGKKRSKKFSTCWTSHRRVHRLHTRGCMPKMAHILYYNLKFKFQKIFQVQAGPKARRFASN